MNDMAVSHKDVKINMRFRIPCLLCRLNLPSGSCTQWEIYDDYIKDLERQKTEEAMKSKGGKGKPPASGPGTGKGGQGEALPPMQQQEMVKSVRIVDRMVNQNMFEEVAMDFKYWEDASDAFRCGKICVKISCKAAEGRRRC